MGNYFPRAVYLLLHVCCLQRIHANAQDNHASEPTPVLEDIKDVEILTYFLLDYHNYYQTRSLSSTDPFGTLDEPQLHEFIRDLKQGKINRRFQPHAKPYTCSAADGRYKNNTSLLRNETKTSHEMKRLEQLCKAATTCQSSKDLITLIADKLKFNEAIVRLCPLLLFQLHDPVCTKTRETAVTEKMRPSAIAVWGFGILFVTIISFCSLVGIAIMPFLNKSSYLNVLNLFEGLAVGSLVGSAIFHLIPQAFDLMGQTQDYLYKSLLIFCGIYVFFWSERIMKIMVDFRRKRKLQEAEHYTSVSDNSEPKLLEITNIDRHVSFKESKGDELNGSVIHTEKREKFSNGNNNENVSKTTQQSKDKLPVMAHQHHEHAGLTGESSIATVAWMIIFGDGFHNFIDGLSVGAAFSESILSGISISVAVICEEFPHELGDFAVLIASGMTTRQAVGYNFISACTCYIGMALGILLGDFTQGSTYIFAFAGGMFLYIALVDMMAELSSGLDEALTQSKSQMFKILFLQNVGILLGVSVLFLLAKYSEHINFEGLAPPPSPMTK